MPPIGPDELGLLLDQHGAPLALYARQWCASPEDVVQEAFVQLARQPEPPRSPAAWLFRAVRNGAIAASRSTARRRRREQAQASTAGDWFIDRAADQLDGAAVAAALQELPSEQREVIIARLWGQLTLEEIAELTGGTTSSVHRWYHAGLAALRKRFNPSCPTTNQRQTH